MSENVFDKAKISDEEWSRLQISRLSSRPNAKTAYGSGGYDATGMKNAFDAQGNLLKERHNILIEYAKAEESARATEESIRKKNETERISNEEDRLERFSEIEKLVGNLPKSLEEILALQELLIGGEA